MKMTKKIASFSAALIMAATFAVPTNFITGFAADGGNNTITIESDGLNHSALNAYQIFTGTANSADTTLGVTGWGDGIKSADFLTALQSETSFAGAFTSCKSAADVAKVVSTFGSNSDKAKTFAKIAVNNLTSKTSGTLSSNQITGLPDGYYVIVDDSAATGETDGTGNSTYTSPILHVSGGSTTEITPKTNLPTVEKKVSEGADWQDVADANIGDTVKFRLTATLPDNFDEYNQYYLSFTDSLDSAFGNVGSVKYYIIKNGTEQSLADSTFTPDTSNIGNMTFTCTNVKAITGIEAGDKIVVEYTADLATTAKINPSEGNNNTVTLTYSNNPNVTVDGDAEPGDPKNPTGETPEDKVRVLTYQFNITKTDGTNALEGAGFKIQRTTDNKWATIADNTITGWVDVKDNGTEVVSDNNGEIKIIGLDDGTYSLEETTVPTGFNAPDAPFEVVIDSTIKTDWETGNPLTGFSITVGDEDGTADKNTGIVAAEIENNKGGSLPSTGGVGTTIFYVAGGILVVGSGVLLITKKRMKNNEN